MATAAKKALWGEAFDYMDKDKDGKINRDEIQQMIDKAFGLQPIVRKSAVGPEDEGKDLEDLEAEADKEEERREALEMDRKEYMKNMEKWADFELKEEAIIDAWKVFDKDGRGIIRTPEVRQYMTTIGDKLDDDEVEALIALADPEETGQVEYEPMVKKAFEMASKGK